MGQPGSGSNDGMPLKLSTADPEKHLSFVSPEAGVGPRGAYALKGSGSKEADKDFVGYGLQPMEIASACQDNAKPLASFQVHAKHGQQHWVSPTFKATSYTPPAPVKRVGAGRPLPTSSQAYVYWDDVEGGPKPQGSFVLFANATMLKQGRVGSMFVRALNHTDIPTGTERSNITVRRTKRPLLPLNEIFALIPLILTIAYAASTRKVVRYNTDGNGALSSTIDSPNTAT